MMMNFTLNASIRDKLFSRASTEIYNSIKRKIKRRDVIVIEKFTNDKNDDFRKALSKKITEKGRFSLLDQKNLDKLLRQSSLQEDLAFQNGEVTAGNFVPAKWIILGETKYRSWEKYFKKHHKLEIEISLDNLKTGEKTLFQKFKYSKKENPSFIKFMLICFTLFSIGYLLNFYLKGYFSNIIVLGMVLSLAIYGGWYFFL